MPTDATAARTALLVSVATSLLGAALALASPSAALLGVGVVLVGAGAAGAWTAHGAGVDRLARGAWVGAVAGWTAPIVAWPWCVARVHAALPAPPDGGFADRGAAVLSVAIGHAALLTTTAHVGLLAVATTAGALGAAASRVDRAPASETTAPLALPLALWGALATLGTGSGVGSLSAHLGPATPTWVSAAVLSVDAIPWTWTTAACGWLALAVVDDPELTPPERRQGLALTLLPWVGAAVLRALTAPPLLWASALVGSSLGALAVGALRPRAKLDELPDVERDGVGAVALSTALLVTEILTVTGALTTFILLVAVAVVPSIAPWARGEPVPRLVPSAALSPLVALYAVTPAAAGVAMAPTAEALRRWRRRGQAAAPPP